MIFSQLRIRPELLAITGKIITGCCLLAWFTLALKAQASIDCSLYVLPEFQRLCRDYPAEQRYIDNDIPDNDLIKLIKSWDDKPGLHILPPGQYALSSYLSLASGQAILPNPSTILSQGKLRTIELVPDTTYVYADDRFFVLKLEYGSRAGGIEVHAGKFGSLSTNKPKSLVVMASGNTQLLGSFLEGDQNYAVNQLVLIHPRPGTKEQQPVLLERNWLDARGAQAGVLASLDGSQQLTVRNSTIHVRTSETAGLQINGGIAEVFTSDINIDSQCENCLGINFRNNKLLGLIRTAFWGGHTGTAIRVFLSGGTNDFEHGLFKLNAFSPALEVLSVNYPQAPLLLSGTEYNSEALAGGYPEQISVADFFNYPVDRGVATLGSQFVDSGCLFNRTDVAQDPACFQNNTELSGTDFNLYYPPAVPGFPCHPKDCINPDEVISYFTLSEFLAGGIISVTTVMLCYFVGKRLKSREAGGTPLLSGSSKSLNEPI